MILEKMENELRRITSRFSPDWSEDIVSAATGVHSRTEIRVRKYNYNILITNNIHDVYFPSAINLLL
ncbi:hypothetical protein BXY_38360 [Bacteroides xylanisolvens XB1A]|uniref:Uncharacterized protein n=1 Tax=Bacteroides xylanisolvens XB1A TaxID=657309 RepID=D6D2Y5_9BACE|nr:hypothetical protein BXY_38360 [Bacteroides xylanisolvens XB1A]